MTFKNYKPAVLALPLLMMGACTGDVKADALAATASSTVSTPADAPNVIFILVDDMGYGQLGVTGHPIIKTPNFDKLANDGILFTQAYSGSTVCSPSRISLMTGKDTGALHSNANTIKLRPGDRTLAHMMSGVGYKTALFGKYGIGTTFGKTDPMTMGFQTWYGLLHNITAHRQFPIMMFRDNDMEFVSPNVGGAEGAYAQELFTDAAVDYIKEHDDDNPFFMLLSYTSPHAELAAPEEFVAPYSGKFEEENYPGAPYRGGKRDLYDGGIHVPMIAHWPAKITEGRVNDTPMAFADILPTLADLANAPKTAMKGLNPNGTSVLPIIVNPDAELDERVLYWEFAQQLGDPNSGVVGTVKQAARRGDWKIVRLREEAEIELYNIMIDKSENKNLAADYPEVAIEFETMFDARLTD